MSKEKTKLFQVSELFDGTEVFPTILVTIVNHWDGKKAQKRALINYIILGKNVDQETAYDCIIHWYPNLLKNAEQYANANSDVIWHQ